MFHALEMEHSGKVPICGRDGTQAWDTDSTGNNNKNLFDIGQQLFLFFLNNIGFN